MYTSDTSDIYYPQAETVEALVVSGARQRAGAWTVLVLVVATMVHLVLGGVMGLVCRGVLHHIHTT